MTYKPLLLIFTFLLTAFISFTQCLDDRHSSVKSDAWMSCEETISPNPNRGSGHWISYDLGEIRRLGQMHFWNANHPDQLDDGARTVFIDYSLDGVTWVEWGIHEFERATSLGTYEGQAGPDFDGLETRHLMFTIRGNHGGDCYGFSELRVAYSEPVSTEEQDDHLSAISLFPNPAIESCTFQVISKLNADSDLSILDVTGKLIYQEDVSIMQGENIFPLNLQGIPSGNYMVRLSSPQFDRSIELNVTSN